MDTKKVGALIRALRREKGLTQKTLAQQLGLSDKAVSKWERAQGCPDIEMLPLLSRVLGADMESLLRGEISRNGKDGGNVKKIRFYVCPQCGNVMTSTGEAQIVCCSRPLQKLMPTVCDDAHRLKMEPMDGEMYIEFDHPMEKEHYIRFIACMGYDRMLLVRLYPEQGAYVRVPYMPRCTYYIGCSKDGLLMQKT